MKTVVFSTKKFERDMLGAKAQDAGLNLEFLDTRLNQQTAALADGATCVSVFVNDDVSRPVIETLARGGTKLLATRSAGFNHIDLDAADDHNLAVTRVPAYSPNAVAEHAIAIVMCLNRKLHKAYHRVRELNFSIDGLMGFDMHGKTVGVIGTGKIGTNFARIAKGFGCNVIGFDPHKSEHFENLGAHYTSFDQLTQTADIISLHCPLTPETHHLIDADTLANMKKGATIVNTSRGALIDTKAVIHALKQRHLGALGLDVYEEEERYFFRDLSDRVIDDDLLARLLTFPNVLITSHQGFFTREAVEAITDTTIESIRRYAEGGTDALTEENTVRTGVHA